MKRNALFAAFLAFALFLASAACADDVTGYWVSTGMDVGDGKIVDVIDESLPVSVIAHFQLNADKSVVAVMMGERDPGGLKWDVDNEFVVFSGLDEEPVKALLKDGKIILDMGDGVSVFLEKQAGSMDVDAVIAKAKEVLGE